MGLDTRSQKKAALEILQQLHELSHRKYVSSYDMAMIHLDLADHAEAFAGLNQAVAERSLWLGYLTEDGTPIRWVADRPSFRRVAVSSRIPAN